MKKIVKLLSPLTLLLLLFVGCEDDDPDLQVVPLQEDSFELIVPTITNINLNFTLPDNPAFTLSWNDVASNSATYTVEASAEETFASPITLGTTQNRTFTMTVAEFNPVVIGAGGEAFSPFILHMRVSNGAETTATVSYSVSAYTETPPEISDPDTGTELVLSSFDPAAIALTMQFNDPDFGEGDVVSVDYTLEFTLPDTNFEIIFTSTTTNERSLALTHDEINTIALGLGLTPEQAANVEVRLRAVIESESGMLERFSEAIMISLTPYDATYPFRDLFMVGNAVDVNNDGIANDMDWDNNGNNPPLFRDSNNANRYVFRGNFGGGLAFKALEIKGSWQPQWGLSGGNLTSSADLGSDPGVFPIPAEGYYEIELDIVNATYTATPYDASGATTYATIGIIGSATPGGWDADTDMTQAAFNPHLWFINDIALVDGEVKFRADDDWAVNWGGGVEFSSLGDTGNDNIPVSAETYDVWFNDLDGSYILIPNLND
ncbi:SusE domain-containing protein [Muricauda sp. SCSIO 64092]|uniref:SusE domain-containing protein n=1 Tax=Allomuricauda sp. SCSIO 64092 TaxID=2908842 RepID=UPI001FF67933|nr:SusE domain-containing protein [Muricauda sp. SCSIO 64092]UOY04830.1 SusE domain-containing protein [Muricauda sp. SCSIO 64092]